MAQQRVAGSPLTRVRELIDERWMLLGLFRFAAPRPTAGLIAAIVIVSVAPVLTAYLTASLVATVVAADDVTVTILLPIVTAIGMVALINVVANGLLGALNEYVARTIDARVRSRIRWAASVALPFAVVEGREFQLDAVRAGDPGAMSRNRLAGTAAVGQLWLMGRFLGGLGLCVVIATVDPWVAIATFMAAVWIRGVKRRDWVLLARLGDAAEPAVQDAESLETALTEPRYAREFEVFGIGGWFIDRWRQAMTAATADHDSFYRRIVRSQWFPALLAFLHAALTFGLLGAAFASGRIDAAQVALALTAVVAAINKLAGMGGEAWDIDYGLMAARAFERIDARATTAASNAQPPPADDQRTPSVTLRGVTFAYDDRAVLDGLNLELRPGERLALVGRNGAGKSTLTKLLCGLYAPDSGTVAFDGIPTSDPVGLAAATRGVAVMYQESLHLPLDVRGNVTVGAAADDDQVWAALQTAGLADALRADGSALDTPLWSSGDGGRDLSGGQWQRIALARAVLAVSRGKRILVLDEPTSQFDVEGETRFYDEVMAALPDISVVLITHRLSTIRRADRIAMLDGGRITELGDHDTLMRQDGAYAAMFRLQAERFTEPAP